MAGNKLTFAATLDDNVSKGLSLISKRFKESNTQASLLGNVGAKAVSAGFGLVSNAVSGAVGFLMDSANAAAEEEKSIALLTQSLKANIPAWDGNSAAIEKVLKSRMRLGFADDEQRKSLTILVGATHDVTKALDLQRTAMDLAAYKGISLEEASTALIKVEGGQYRALKALGIILPAHATATEALTAVQKVAAGQAEALANTNSGKLKASQVAVGEAMEIFGAKVLPLVVEGTKSLADGVTALAQVFDIFNGKIPTTDDELGHMGITLASLNPAMWGFGRAIDDVKNRLDAQTKATEAAKTPTYAFAGGIDFAAGKLLDFARTISAGKGYISSYGQKMRDINREIVDSFKRTRDELTTIGNQTADAFYDPLIKKAQLEATQRDIIETTASIKSGKLKSKELAAAKLHLLELRKTAMGQILDLSTYQGAQGLIVLKAQIEALKNTRHKTAEQIANLKLLEAEYGKLRLRALQANAAMNQGRNQGGGSGGGKAGGGPVPPGVYTVGEEGPETLVQYPGGGGFVIPNANSKPGGGGGGVHLHISSVWPPTPQQIKAMADALDHHDYWAGLGAAATGNRT